MKKSVIVLIGIIYVMAIVTVSFFGLTIKGYDSTTYVTNVYFTNEGIEELENGDKIIYVNFSESNTFQLEWKVTPDEATYKDVDFAYDTTSTIGSVDRNGLVTFNKRGVLTVHVHSIDGSTKSDSLKVIAE